MLKISGVLVVLIAVGVVAVGASFYVEGKRETVVPGRSWERVPGAEGAEAGRRLEGARKRSEELGSTAVMIVQGGKVVAAWGDVAHKSNLHSIRKSVLSALIGVGVERGQIDLGKTLEELGVVDNEPGLTKVELGATVHDLLKARSGVFHPALYETESMKKKRPARGSHAPGRFWYYNNWDFNALGTIYERAAGKSIFQALDDDVARPIGMEDYEVADGSYVTGPDSDHRAYPIEMSARDLARFALLFLREGQWNGKQVIPRQWVRDSVRPYSETESGGYGYMWWINDYPDGRPGALVPGSYYAAGAGGQAAYVVPELDLVVIHRVDTKLTDKRVTREQIGQLVALIVEALGKKP